MTSLHRSDYKALIAELVKARKAVGMTQEELAARLKKPQSYVSKYEKCERRLDVIELIDICKILQIGYNDIIERI